MLCSFSLPEPSIVVPSALDKKKPLLRKTRARHDEEASLHWTSSNRVWSAAAETKPHSPSEGRGLKCLPLRYGPAECVWPQSTSLFSALWERTLSFHRRPSRTLRGGFFSVKQLAESDLGDSHQTSSCSWAIWRGDRARMSVTAGLSGLFLFSINAEFDASHIISKTNWSNSWEEIEQYLCFASYKQSTYHQDHRTLIYSAVEYFQLHPPRQREQ